MEKVRTVYLKTSVEDPDIADCGFGSLYTDWECLIYASGCFYFIYQIRMADLHYTDNPHS